jgi:hypothetical protein
VHGIDRNKLAITIVWIAACLVLVILGFFGESDERATALRLP